MDIYEASAELGITRGAIRDAVSRGRLAVVRKNGTERRAGYLLFARAEIERYKRENRGKRGFASSAHPYRASSDEPPAPAAAPSADVPTGHPGSEDR